MRVVFSRLAFLKPQLRSRVPKRNHDFAGTGQTRHPYPPFLRSRHRIPEEDPH